MKKEFGYITKERIERLRTDPYFADLRAAVLKRAEELDSIDPPRVKYTDIHDYLVSGSRTKFANTYGFYEGALNTYFAAYVITEDKKYIPQIADYMWNICDFETWTIPAHVSEGASVEWRRRSLDLCSTLLAGNLSMMLFYMYDELPELVARRAKAEIRYRMIDSFAMYDEHDYDWMVRKSNWSAVCIAGVFATYVFLAEEEEIQRELPRMIRAAECYLEGFADDGCCSEGIGYWNYGFSYFCQFATMLREYTGGEFDFFKREKVHRIALFQQNIMMNEKQTLSFSDGSFTFSPHVGLTHLLRMEYPDVRVPATPKPSASAPYLYSLLWQEPSLEKGDGFTPSSYYFENAQWYLNHKPSYTLGAKAGHNAEQHNQNDVGSFMISKGGRITFVDPGAGEYTKDYFSRNRYDIFVCSSRGHSVPIINGEYQVQGRNPSTVDEHSDTRFAFNMERAYAIPTLSRLYRDFKLDDDRLTLTDTYTFTEKPQSVNERFVSLLPIEGGDGVLKSGDSTLRYDPEKYEVSVCVEDVARGGGRSEQVYYVDLTVREPSESMTLEFIFE